MDPNAAADIVLNTRATRDERYDATENLIAWLRSGGFLPTSDRIDALARLPGGFAHRLTVAIEARMLRDARSEDILGDAPFGWDSTERSASLYHDVVNGLGRALRTGDVIAYHDIVRGKATDKPSSTQRWMLLADPVRSADGTFARQDIRAEFRDLGAPHAVTLSLSGIDIAGLGNMKLAADPDTAMSAIVAGDPSR